MRLIIRTDGGSRGNPGPAGAGVVIRDGRDELVFAGGFYLGSMTNNLAEYHALLIALELATQIGGTQLEIYSDSELLVRQVNGQYRVKNEHLQPLHRRVIDFKEQCEKFAIAHVYREENEEADAMVNRAISAKADVGGFIGHAPDGKKNPGQASAPDPPDIPNGLSIYNLDQEITFEDKHAHQKTLGAQSGLIHTLICLKPHQRYAAKSEGSTGSVLILQGRGTVQSDGHILSIGKNSWMEWPPPRPMEFIAGDESMIFLITHLRKKG
jgi:ribonuclease HI